MEKLGLAEGQYNVSRSGDITIYSGSVTAAEVTKGYAETALMTQAKRFGWSVSKQPNGKLLVQKASF